jgi:hypothetical protein
MSPLMLHLWLVLAEESVMCNLPRWGEAGYQHIAVSLCMYSLHFTQCIHSVAREWALTPHFIRASYCVRISFVHFYLCFHLSMLYVCRRQKVGAKVQCTSCYTAYHPLCARYAGLHMEIMDNNDGSDGPVRSHARASLREDIAPMSISCVLLWFVLCVACEAETEKGCIIYSR